MKAELCIMNLYNLVTTYTVMSDEHPRDGRFISLHRVLTVERADAVRAPRRGIRWKFDNLFRGIGFCR